jgi:hypothetical protein
VHGSIHLLGEDSVASRSSNSRLPFRLALILALLGAAFAAPSAGAGLLFTGPPATCETETSKPFRPWSDYANYVLVSGGAFEGSAPGWTLKGGAAVASGNETFYVRSTADRYSLHLPAGSSAITPTMCFALGDWHLRFFARRTSTTSGTVKVDVVVKSLLGVVSVLDGGSISATGEWKPSPQVGLLLTNVTSLIGTRAVAFRFRPSGASFRIDDVYLDPWKSY